MISWDAGIVLVVIVVLLSLILTALRSIYQAICQTNKLLQVLQKPHVDDWGNIVKRATSPAAQGGLR